MRLGAAGPVSRKLVLCLGGIPDSSTNRRTNTKRTCLLKVAQNVGRPSAS